MDTPDAVFENRKRTAFVYSGDFARFNYGASHPLKPWRLKLTYDLIRAFGLLHPGDARCVEPRPAEDRDLMLFHDASYLEVLKKANEGKRHPDAYRHGLGSGDNPVFRGLLDWSRLVVGASLKATSLVLDGHAEIAFNISGGLHHAAPSRASGFCYVNDAAIAIRTMRNRGLRVAYVDIDAHHGDGVQDAFYDTDQVLTISIHETGRALFPGTGFEYELGRGKGEGYSINVPMPPGAGDDLFLYAFEEVVPPLLRTFKPDVVVSQLGVDSFRTDPLAGLNYTTQGFCAAVARLRDLAPRWVALGGGGYDVGNVARAWTLAWAVMNDVEVPDEIPERFLADHAGGDFSARTLHDPRPSSESSAEQQLRLEVERVVGFIREKVIAR